MPRAVREEAPSKGMSSLQLDKRIVMFCIVLSIGALTYMQFEDAEQAIFEEESTTVTGEAYMSHLHTAPKNAPPSGARRLEEQGHVVYSWQH